jgi:membrane glycosyltransferase
VVAELALVAQVELVSVIPLATIQVLLMEQVVQVVHLLLAQEQVRWEQRQRLQDQAVVVEALVAHHKQVVERVDLD